MANLWLDHALVGLLYEGKLVIDKTFGHASYGCASCCGYYTPSLTPNPFSGPPGIYNDDVIEAKEQCGGYIDDVTGGGYAWQSNNTAVATLPSKILHTVAVGGATGNSFVYVQATHPAPRCPMTTYGPTQPVSVKQVTVTLNAPSLAPGSQTSVTVTLQPAASGQSVSLQHQEVQFSGGHQHSGRTLGTFGTTSGSTDANGKFSTTYTTTSIAGQETITGTIDGIPSTATLTVGVFGLTQLTTTKVSYGLVGSTTTHPRNHFATTTLINNIIGVADQFFSEFGQQLLFNDMSLPQGGVFDLNANWSSPHIEHREGRNVDLNPCWDATRENRLRDIVQSQFFGTFSKDNVSGCNYHITF